MSTWPPRRRLRWRQRGWQRHRPQPIVVQFMPPRAAAVVAQPINAARVAGPTAGSAACTAVLPATDVVDAAALRDAADACAARQVDTSIEAMSLAADEGRVTGQAAIERSWLVGQMARLVAMLPMVSLIKCCAARSSAELVAMGYERIAHHVIERAPKPWKWSTVKDACNNWARWLLWLDRHTVEHDGVHFTAVDLGDFYEEADAAARAKGPANKARAAAMDAKAAAEAAAKGLPAPPPRRWQDGSQAIVGIKRGHRFMVNHFGILIPVQLAGVHRAPGARPRQPSPCSLTLEMMYRLEAYVVAAASGAANVCKFHAAVAAGLLFCGYSCNRAEQANACAFERIVGGFLFGVLLLDKHPNPDKRTPRPFWMRIKGPVGGRVWFDYLLSLLVGVEGGCFVFRDFDSESGDPGSATRFLNNPLMGARLLHAIRCVLMRVCGMTWAQATLYALHSARHFFLEAAGARDMAPLRAVELGRWSGSTAQDFDLTPAARLARRHEVSASTMPESYAPQAKVARVCEIVGGQMAAIDALYVASRPDGLPLFGGFEPLRQWPDDPDAE